MEVCRNKLKERIRGIHSRVESSVYDTKTSLQSRVGIVKTHRHLVTRAREVAPCPALIPSSKALTDRINSLDLTTTLNEHVFESSSLTVGWCKEVIMGIEKELQMLADQTTKPLVNPQQNIASSTQDMGLTASSSYTREAGSDLSSQNTSDPVEAMPSMLQHPTSHDDYISGGRGAYEVEGVREWMTRPLRIRFGQRVIIASGPLKGKTGTVTHTERHKAEVELDSSHETFSVRMVQLRSLT